MLGGEACCVSIRCVIGDAEPLAAVDRKGFAHDLAALLRGCGSETMTDAVVN